MSTFVIYPIQIDSKCKKSDGRKYCLQKCVENPTIDEIEHACNALSIPVVIEKEKRHPRTPEKYGRARFDKNLGKKGVIIAIKQEILILRTKEKESQNIKKEQTRAVVGSKILMPKSKKKKEQKKLSKSKN